jgi:hypothetical protein
VRTRTAAVIGHTLLDLLSDAKEAAAVEVLAETINQQERPASPRY